MSERFYIIKGRKYDSVTTVLQIIAKMGLMYFYGKHGTEKATKIKNKAARHGKSLHKLIHKDMKHMIEHGQKGIDGLIKPYEDSSKYKRVNWMLEQYRGWKHKYKAKPVLTELVVCSKKHRYAGTLDSTWWITYKGKRRLCLVDWKTSKKAYKDYMLQVVAYWYALKERWPNDKTSMCMIVSFDKEQRYGEPDILIVKKKRFKKLFKVFLHAMAVWKWSQKNK